MGAQRDAVAMQNAVIDGVRDALEEWRTHDRDNTDQRIADMAGMERAMVTRFRNRNRDLALTTLCRLAAALDIEIGVITDRRKAGPQRCQRTKDMFKKED